MTNETLLRITCGGFALSAVVGFGGLAWYGPTWAQWAFGVGLIGFIAAGVVLLNVWCEPDLQPWENRK